jgi:septal ring factor EnvC (AmiA/AmiB activator)
MRQGLAHVLTVAVVLGACVPGLVRAEGVKLDAADKLALNQRYAAALQTELGLLKALDQIDRDAVDLDGQIVRLSVDRAKATDAMQAAEQRRATAELELARMREAVQDRLRAFLRVRSLPALRFALSAADFETSVIKDRLLRRLLEGDRKRLAEYRQRLIDLERLTHERDAALQKMNALDLALHERSAKGEQERRDKVALIQQLDDDRKYAERLGKDTDAAHRQLTAQIATLQEWQERKYTFALTQGKLLPPVTGRVEVGFGEVKHPRFGTVTMHRGLDYRAVGQNVPIRVVFWGRVAYVGWLTGYGDTVIVDHGRGWHTVYAHLENVRVAVGDVVAARTRIADVGQSGSIKGRYLYFEIRHNGQPVDPSDWFHHP